MKHAWWRATVVCLAGTLGTAAQAQNYIGISAAVAPRYEGAKDYRFLPVPLIHYENGPFFISPRAGLPSAGLKWQLGEHVHAGVFVGAHLGRDADDSDILHGLDDIDMHATYGAYIEWQYGALGLGAAYRQAARSGYGGVGELRATYRVWQIGRDSVSVGARTEWASDDYMRTWYGISASQAARSEAGLRRYSASSGFKSGGIFASWTHRLDQSWAVNATAGVNTLFGDARDSPVSERSTNYFGGVGLTYAF